MTRPAGRLLAATRNELRLLFRQGVGGAVLVLALAWVVVLRLLPEGARPVGLEVVTFAQLAVLGYSFAGAAVLLDRQQRTLHALAVTPLRLAEQLAARVLALTALASAATAVVVVGGGQQPATGAAFAAGTLAASGVALVTSLAVVAPHRSLSRWLLPSVPPMLLLAVPAVAYAGIDGGWLWLLPTQGALTLLRGPSSPAAGAAAVIASAAWVAGIGALAHRRFSQALGTGDG